MGTYTAPALSAHDARSGYRDCRYGLLAAQLRPDRSQARVEWPEAARFGQIPKGSLAGSAGVP